MQVEVIVPVAAALPEAAGVKEPKATLVAETTQVAAIEAVAWKLAVTEPAIAELEAKPTIPANKETTSDFFVNDFIYFLPIRFT